MSNSHVNDHIFWNQPTVGVGAGTLNRPTEVPTPTFFSNFEISHNNKQELNQATKSFVIFKTKFKGQDEPFDRLSANANFSFEAKAPQWACVSSQF